MKIRKDFVTNSSSSSFIIAKKNLDEEQMEAIRKHWQLAEKLGMLEYGDAWRISENDEFISGDTYMDNFDFADFFRVIDVNNNVITWGDYPFNIDDTEINEFIENEVEIEPINWRDILKEI